IVSAAAAALLAVAPVAATVAPAASTTVSAETVQYGNQIGALNTDGNLGTIDVKDPNASSVETNIQNQVKKQLGLDDAVLTNFQVTKSGNTYTATFGVSSASAKKGNWWQDVKVNGKVVNGLQWRKDQATKSTGDLYTTAGLAKYSVVLNKTTTPSDTASPSIDAGSSSIFDQDANTVVNISAVAATDAAPSSINGNIVYTDAKGQSYTALLHGVNGINATIYQETKDGSSVSLKPVSNVKALSAGRYLARLNDVTVNLGNAAAGQTVTFKLGKGSTFKSTNAKDSGHSLTVTVDGSGVAHLGEIDSEFWAYDSQDLQEVHFYSVKTGNVVTSGSVDLHARANDGMLNVNSVFAALTQEYRASQLDGHKNVDQLLPVNDIRDQLKKQNVTVDPNGYFKAPASFTINFNAKSNNNGATASLPVTVNVDNAAQTPAANETTKNVTIMHISTIYDKNGKATHEPAL
ncbi:hypothetical protein, partial [Lactobacillus kitasatonis]